MASLKAGGTAVDAVELAIKVLEDREVTNAGYGSNLAIDGTVECDAIVVDHDGRSGAVGAVARKLTLLSGAIVADKILRDQEPSPACPLPIRQIIEAIDTPPSSTQLARWSRRYGLCLREWIPNRST